MDVEIGTEAAQFLIWEHINGISVAVQDSHGVAGDSCLEILSCVSFLEAWYWGIRFYFAIFFRKPEKYGRSFIHFLHFLQRPGFHSQAKLRSEVFGFKQFFSKYATHE
jgi:hypothetical protein